MTKHAYPEYHKALLEQSAYPVAPRKVKFEETRRSCLYRTGEHVYKVRKTSPLYASLALKERYAQEALRLGRRWAGEVMQDVVPIVRKDGGYAMGGEGEPVDYALRMAQLPDAAWMHRALAHDKLTPTLLGRLARFLAEQHAAAALEEKAADGGRPEHVQDLVEDLAYQSRKYAGQTVSQPVLDMIVRPLARFIEEHRKLLLRRQKRGHIVDGHGALVPEHLYLRGNDVIAVSPLEAQPKYRRLDAANDLAVLLNELVRRGAEESAELLLKRYVSTAKDRDLTRVLPLYRVLQALRCGLLRSEWRAELPPEAKERQTLAEEAGAYYNLALQAAREMPKSA